MKSRAALFHRTGTPLEVAEIEIEEPGPGDVLVRMSAVGLCGSDLHVVRGEWPRPTPTVLGHEGSGVVAAVGGEVEHLAPGDHVVLSWAPACGGCGPCRRGRPGACLRLREAFGKGTLVDGTTRLRRGAETIYRMTAVGALAEHVLLPAYATLPVPADVPLEQAALLGCAALTGMGAVRNAARVPAGSSVIVYGAGGVGQFIVQGARIAGADPIVVVDPIAARAEKAIELGATHTLDPDVLADVAPELLGEGADFAFEAVGRPDSEAAALRFTRAGGTVVLVGMPPVGTELRVDPFDFAAREKTLTGSIYGSEDPARALPAMLDLVRAGDLRLGPLVGPTFPLDDVNAAFAATMAGEPRRVLVSVP
jgi:S-(hydroxymethyl)glutathione dehydrogenase/alcohol dehydrogenase